MTDQIHSPFNALSSVPFLDISVFFEASGRIAISGFADGFANGTEVGILILDTQGNSTTVTAIVQDGAFELRNLDERVFTPGNLTITASAGNTMAQQTLALLAKPDTAPIVIDEQPLLNALNQLSIRGKAPSLEPGDEVKLVIRDVNGTSVTATAAVQSDGRFSVQGISTQGLIDGTLFIDVMAQTDTGTISVMNAANLELVIPRPEGADKTLALNEDTPLALSAADFGYDNSDGFNLTGIKVAGLPGAGRLQLNGVDVVMDDFVSVAQLNAGQLLYRPPLNANGNALANFKFKVMDDRPLNNEDREANTITFNVTPVNDAPTGANNTITILEDGSRTLAAADFGFADAADTPANTLSAVIITSLPTAGTLKFNGVNVTLNQSIPVASLGSLVYAPAANDNGTGYATIGFKVVDNGGTANGGQNTSVNANTLTFNVTAVNDAPVNTVPGPQTTNEDTNKVITGLSVADVDVGSNTMTVTLAVTNGTLTLLTGSGVTLTGNNTASVQLSGTLGAVNALLATANAVTYKPTANYNGSAQLTMTSSDGTLSDTDTVVITVNPVNDAPVLATGSTLSYTENAPATAINTASTVADVDSTTLASATVAITTGFNSTQDVLSLTVNPATMGNITGVYASTTGVMTLTSVGNSATLAQWQAALRAVSYSNTSDNPSTAARTVSYTVNDGTVNGNTVTSTINVTAVNDAPIANGDVSVNDVITTDLLGSAAPNTSSVVTTAVIDGGEQAVAVPAGWTINSSTPDIQSTTFNVHSSSGYTLSNVNGASLNGGTFVGLLNYPATQQAESMKTDFTGLTVGSTYTYGVQWQQMMLQASNATFSGGQLKITIGNTSQTYTSSGVSDGWQKALFTFTATSTSMPVILGINADASNGAIAVDSMTVQQIATATGASNVTVSKTVQELFGGTYTDADASGTADGTFKGVVITSAGTAADATALGVYQYSSDNGTTWATLASGLTESTAVFLAKTDLVRFFASSTNASFAMKPDLVARLVDSSAGSASTSGQVVDVSGINRGGSAPYSGDTVTLRVIPDDTPPTLVGSSPGDNEYMMSLTNNITLNFSEDVVKGTGLIELYKADGTLVQSFDVASSARINGWGTASLMINPNSNLLPNTGYYIKIAPTAVKDSTGNAYAGISDATTLNFTTTDEDGGIPPTAISGAGYVVSSAGDVNGDGFDDVIVGAPTLRNEPYTGAYLAGGAYVIYGNAAGTLPALPMNTATGVNASIAASVGFKISSAMSADSRFGATVSGIGDVNGDGFDDVMMGLGGTNARAFVVYGGATNAGVSIDTAGNINNSQGFKIALASGFDSTAAFGSVVTGLGDVNGDGVADFGVRVISSLANSFSYVLYGSKTNQSDLVVTGEMNQYAIGDASRGYRMPGLVTAVGDMNNDGMADVVATTYNNNDNSSAATIYYSNANGTANTTNAAYSITGTISNSPMRQVTSMGDVNGDGIADLAVLSSNHVFVVYGQTGTTNVALSTLSASQGFKIVLPVGSSHYDWISSAGDVNGDGLADVIIGKQNTYANFAMVVYGNATGTDVQLSHILGYSSGYNVSDDAIPASQGFKISSLPGGEIGYRVSNAGDFNGDGLADLIVGGLAAQDGVFGIVLGGTQFVTNAVQGSGTVNGTSGSEALFGSTANDTLTGGGGVDRFFAGEGNDTIVLMATDVTNLANVTTGQTVKATIDGGGGFDTLRLTGGANLNLTTISNVGGMGLEENSRIERIERIDLATDTAANTLTLSARDVNDMAGFNLIRTGSVSADGKTWTNVSGTALAASTRFHQLVVDGSANDQLMLMLPGQWAAVGTVNDGTHDYVVHQNSPTQSQVIVRQGVVVTVDTPPLLISSNPADDSYVTTLGNDITLKFNEAVVKGVGTITLHTAAGTLVQSFNVASSNLVTGWDTDQLTINPTNDLLAGTSYYLRIGTAAIQDVTGNSYAGITDNTSLNFTTANANGSFTVATAYTGAYRVSNAGDVNADGYEDVIVANPSGGSAAYVVYGNAQGVAVNLAAGTIAANKGFKIVGVAGSFLGTSVSSAGDINGDGFADVLVGAVGVDAGGTTSAEGAAYVVYGSASGSTVNLANFQASQGVVFIGQTGESLGRVSLAGDINGDGLSDLLLGTISGGNEGSPGRAYLIYGQSSGMAHNFFVDPTLNPSQGMVLTGNADSGGARQVGWFPSSAGDFNGDGYADMIFPSYAHDDAYIILGGPNSLLGQDVSSSTLGDPGFGPGGDLDSLVAMGRGIKLHGDVSGMGHKVHGLGDVNGDGLSDVALVSNAGSSNFNVRVVYGTNANVNNIFLNTSASSQGFRINSDAADSAMMEVSSAGDMNGDGLADILVSGRKLNNVEDWAYVVYGSSNASNLNLTNLTIAADRGFRLQGTAVGYGQSTAGDFNGDGLTDLIFGNDDNGTYSVVMGGTQWVTGAVNGAGAFSGSASNEVLIGSAGNDTLTGGGGVDRFFAGKGNDTIVITVSDVANLQSNTPAAVKASVDGGTGFNTLRLSGGANLDLNRISNVGAGGTEESSRIENISRIDLATDSAANVLKIAAKDVSDMTGLNQIRIGTPSEDGQSWTNLSGTPLSTITRLRQMVIEGGSNDTVVLNTDEGMWANVGSASNGSHTYTVYQNDANTAQVLVRQGVTVRTQAPTLLWTSPADNDFVNTDQLGQDITLRFSEVVVKGTGQIRLWNLSDNALVESFDVATSSLVSGWNSNTLTLNPTANLLPGKQYTVLVSDYAVHNSAGVAYAGVEDVVTLNFNTQSNDGSYAVTESYLSAFSTRRTLVDVSSAGDFNGDGYDDLLVMAPGNTTEPTGFAYVVFGNAEGTGQHLNDLAGTLPPERGVKITGDFANMSGSVSSLGDINGDGFADVLMGSNSNNGNAYVVYGRANPAELNFSNGNIAASDGFKITGHSSFRLGGNVSNAGDFNGDGINDFILGAWTSNASGVTSSGSAYVIYGKTNGSNLSLAADGSIAAADGIRLTGAAFDAAGRSVSGAGDVNGDGLADVVVGANGSSTTSGGGGYVILGGATGGDMTTLTNNGMGFKINPFSASGERVGTVVSSLGDVNGDGLADVALSTDTDQSTSSVYVVYGRSAPSAVNLTTGNAIQASDGFRISAATSLGVSLNQVASAGDVNGDGLADMIVGSRNGTAFVVYGSSLGANLSLNNATIEASRGFRLKYSTDNTANSAISVSSAGDLNGDGLGDLIIGDQGSGAAGSYKIVFGGTQWISNAVVGNGTVTGTAASEALLGSDDNDTLVGGGGVDRFFAGKGDDTIVLTGSDYTNLINNTVNGVKASVHGGSGYDSIRLSGGMNLFMPSISNVGGMGLEENSRIESIERIDMATDTLANSLSLQSRDVRDMAGMNLIRIGSVSADGKTWTNVTGTALSATTKFHQLVVDGGSNDNLTLGTDLGFWSVAGTVNNGTHNYTVYQNTGGNAQVLLRSGVVVTNNDPNVAPVFASTTATTAAGLFPLAGGSPVWYRTATYGSSSLGGITTNITATGDSTPTNSYGTGSSAFMWIGDQNSTETLSVSFDNPVYQVKIEFSALNNDGTHKDTLSFQVNGANLVLSSANLSPTGTSVSGNTITGNGGGVYSITSSTAINSLSVTDTISGGPSGVGVAIQYAGGGAAISSLMPAATDADGRVVGYAITSAATETGADTTPGRWEYWNGSTWISLANASVSQAVYLNASTFVRWNDNDTGYTALSAVAVDSTVVATLGQALDVSTRGGTTAFSTGIATLTATVAPVVLDLNRDGDLAYSQMLMDINSDGRMDLTAWAAAEDGVLVWDKHSDGLVHDHSQYAFAQYAGFAGATDLQGLAEAFDSNRDGVFDGLDAQFSQFAVWQDLDQDGMSDEGEVRSLADWGIAAINLVSDGVVQAPALGVQEAGRSTAQMADGSEMVVADAAFAYQTVPQLDLAGFVAQVQAESKAQPLPAQTSVKLFLYDMIQSATAAEQGGGDLFAAEGEGPRAPDPQYQGYQMDLLTEHLLQPPQS